MHGDPLSESDQAGAATIAAYLPYAKAQFFLVSFFAGPIPDAGASFTLASAGLHFEKPVVSGFQRYVQLESQISRTPVTLAEIENQILNASMGTRDAQVARLPKAQGRFGTRARIPTGRRATGSLGTDVVVYQDGIPVTGFDLKTGRPWSAAKLAEVQRRFGITVNQIRTQ